MKKCSARSSTSFFATTKIWRSAFIFMGAYVGCSSHLHSINMFALLCPTDLQGATGNSSFKTLKSKWNLDKNLFDNVRKPRLSLNLNNINKKKKLTKKLCKKALQSLPCCPWHTIFLTFFPYIFGNTFQQKYNCLKHTMFSRKHKQCLLQALINKSFPSKTVN